MRRTSVTALLWFTFVVLIASGSFGFALGDTLTVIQRPLLNIPAIVVPGDTLTIKCQADEGTAGWAVAVRRGTTTVPMPLVGSTYNPSSLWWEIDAIVPSVPTYDLYDLIVRAHGMEDTARHSVKIIPEFKEDYYFDHITDTHLPTHLYYYQRGAATDSSGIVDLREVIKDINIINPEFVLLTGDLVNEGELEDFLSRHYFSRAQRLLEEFCVPVYLTSGNHDIGGWDATPPPDGTARWNWWKFFGWKRLNNPPPGAPSRTQDYSFNYGRVHYVGLEAYINYDGWRSWIYGGQSFTSSQLQWLVNDLAHASAPTKVLFYHYDFSDQIDLTRLGVDMALSGHIHRDVNDFSPPYDIITNNVCDGERSYRLIRVSDGNLKPSRTISAGYDGRNLDITYQPANDGSNCSVTAVVTNNLNERFEYAVVRFVMPNEPGTMNVEGGDLFQIDRSGPCAIWYVNVDILPSSQQMVTATLDVTPSTSPTVEVVKPNGGEEWHVDSTYEIVWSAEDDIGITSVDILLSTDGGISFEDTIAIGEANDGSYLWTIGPPLTSQARIKVIAYDSDGNTGEDTSDDDFTIVDVTPPYVELDRPVGGEAWAIDSTYTVLWTATDNIGVASITILLSRDGGAAYPETLAVDETNDGQYEWTPQGQSTQHAKLMVIAVDSSGNAATDTSQQDFEIYDSRFGPGREFPNRVVIRSSSPNPFDEDLNIEFGIPERGKVTIAIYDVTGREVAYVGERDFTSGFHHVTWSPGSGVEPGIYFVRIVFHNQAATYKVVRSWNDK